MSDNPEENQEPHPEPARIHLLHTFEGIQYPNFVVDQAIKTLRMFDVRTDDVWIASYPKSGTHWLQEIVGLILSDGYRETADRTLHRACVEMIDVGQRLPRTRDEEEDDPVDMTPFLEIADKAPSPRVLASHLRLGRLPWDLKKGKIIYIARNPKDIITSMYNFYKRQNPSGLVTWEQMFAAFIAGKSMYGPWFEHVREFWRLREQSHLLFVFYEQLYEDQGTWIKRIAEHIGRPLSDEALQRVLDNTKIKVMFNTLGKDEQTQAHYQGKGGYGKWKHQFSETDGEVFDKWFKSKIKGARDLQFKFE